MKSIIQLAAIVTFAVVQSAQAAPTVTFDGDAITVTVPSGTAADGSTLSLCWGRDDAGAVFGKWGHYAILSGDVAATGGVYAVSAATLGVAAENVLRACIVEPYKVVEYVYSTTGTAGGSASDGKKTLAVETGVRAKTGLRVKTKMRWLALGDCDFCGGRYTSGDSTRIFPVHTYQNKWLLGYGSKTTNTVACSTGVDYEVESRLYAGSQAMWVDGAKIYELNESGEVDAGGQCAAFAAYYPSRAKPISIVSHARCYYLKMWENGDAEENPEGDLVRDFVPVKDSLGHGALYDRVTGKVFNSVYSGADPVEYLSVGDETGDEEYEVTIAGAAVEFTPPGQVVGDFHARLRGRTLTITVDPAAVTNDAMALCVGIGGTDCGPDVNDWERTVVVADPLSAIGGVYRVSLGNGVAANSMVRPFLVRKFSTEELSYLRSDANAYDSQYLHTGVPAKSGTRVVTRMSWDNKSFNGGDQSYFAAKYSTGSADRLMMIHCYPSQWGMGYVGGNWSKGAITNGKVCDVEAKAYVRYQMLKVDGDVLYTGSNSTALDFSPADFAVFACSYKNPDSASAAHGGTGLCSASTCYYLKIYSNGDETTNPDGDLVRDFIPARRDGALGLWDKLGEKFYPAQGGSFSGGEVVSVLRQNDYTTCQAATPMRLQTGGLIMIVR